MQFATLILVLGLAVPSTAQSLETVKEHCGQLRGYLAASTGVERALIAHALDECQLTIARLTPRVAGKWERLSGYVAPVLAMAQEGYAAKRNVDWLEQRKRQKNAGQVESNLSTEIVIAGLIGHGIAVKILRGRRRAPEKLDLDHAVTDAVLTPR